MQKKLILETERLVLSTTGINDCTADYLSWLNDYETVQYTDSCNSSYTMENLVAFVRSQEKKSNSVFLAIKLKDSKKHIGNIKIDQISNYNKAGQYGILMGDKAELGKGYAREASIEIIRYCFTELDLHRINLAVVENNVTAVKLYEKIGFVKEGLLRECFYHSQTGKFMNGIQMGLLKSEWQF